MTGTNSTLPNWAMNDLIQVNGIDTKMNAVSAAGPSPTKRVSLRSRAQQQMTEVNNAPQINHKRPSTLESNVNKRLKSNSTITSFNLDNSNTMGHGQTQLFGLHTPDIMQQQKSPHLLQHLMAPSPDRVRKYNGPASKPPTDKLSLDAQWTCVGLDESKAQVSDSVLKNLLVSGCDISAGYVCQVPVRLRKLAKA